MGTDGEDEYTAQQIVRRRAGLARGFRETRLFSAQKQ